jgi:hypothetical protein
MVFGFTTTYANSPIYEKIEDTIWVIRNRILKTNREYMSAHKEDKRKQ